MTVPLGGSPQKVNRTHAEFLGDNCLVKVSRGKGKLGVSMISPESPYPCLVHAREFKRLNHFLAPTRKVAEFPSSK